MRSGVTNKHVTQKSALLFDIGGIANKEATMTKPANSHVAYDTFRDAILVCGAYRLRETLSSSQKHLSL